ncbi:MAG: MFS transporter, partial [Candidatus Dadabacteria bacterium]
MPVIVLFFKENGLSMKDVFILQALFSVAVVIFEIPSGYFSDVVGRRTTLIVGS